MPIVAPAHAHHCAGSKAICASQWCWARRELASLLMRQRETQQRAARTAALASQATTALVLTEPVLHGKANVGDEYKNKNM